jgi:hypothetical protein
MTKNIDIKKNVLLELSSRLKLHGFKKKGDTLLRETEPGLYQIIDIGLGPSWGIKADHVGIGFGIATEEWLNNLISWKRPKTLSSVDCEIRDCYCGVIPIQDEVVWYPVSLGFSSLISKIDSYIQETIVPYFEELKTRRDIISLWRNHKHEIGFAAGRQHLAVGTLMFLGSDRNEGEKILQDLLVDNKDNSYFTSTISKVLKEDNSSH